MQSIDNLYLSHIIVGHPDLQGASISGDTSTDQNPKDTLLGMKNQLKVYFVAFMKNDEFEQVKEAASQSSREGYKPWVGKYDDLPDDNRIAHEILMNIGAQYRIGNHKVSGDFDINMKPLTNQGAPYDFIVAENALVNLNNGEVNWYHWEKRLPMQIIGNPKLTLYASNKDLSLRADEMPTDLLDQMKSLKQT